MTVHIAGDVEDVNGNRVAGCRVNAVDHQGGYIYHDTTDDMGHYDMIVSNYGHYYDMSAYHSGYVIEHQDDIGTPSGGDHDYTVYVDWKPPDHHLKASIVGTVQDDEGLGIPNANVWGVGSTYMFGTSTDSNGDYVLPLHEADTYTIKAVKNNYTVRTYGSITQSGRHPSATTTINFTGSYYLARILGTTNLGYAVYHRSVVIPDFLMDNYNLTHASNPATTTVYMKTRTWGSGGVLWTSTNDASNATEGDGLGGSDYDGDDAYEGEEEEGE